MPAPHQKILGFLAKLLLTCAALWLVFRDMDYASLSALARQQDHGMIAAVIGLILLQILLGALRWEIILNALSGLKRRAVSRLETLALYYVSIFFSLCLPGTVGGDVVRVWLVKSDHVPLPVAINSVVIDRVIALAALMLLLLATLPVLAGLAGFDALKIFPVAIVAIMLGVWMLAAARRLLAPYQHRHLARWLLYFTDNLLLLLKTPRAALASMGYAVLAHLGYCAACYVLARSLGIEIGLMECVTLMPAVMLAVTLPVSIGGWGVREAGMVGMLALAGVPQAQALMLSVELGLLGVLVSLPGGAIWLARKKKTSGGGGNLAQ